VVQRRLASRPEAIYRSLERRGARSDLRDSGALEQDANTVLLLHRPDRYDPAAEPGLTEAIIAKARNAECNTIELDFQGSYQRFRAR
jgi:replicative DNA helicase